MLLDRGYSWILLAAALAGCGGPRATPSPGPSGCVPAPPPAQCTPTGERPTRRSEFSAIYDEAGHRMILHGGSTAVPTSACDFPAPIFSAETWAYDDSCAEWRWLDILGGPGPRARHSAVYDPAARRMLVFGGRYRAAASGAYTLYNDVWALDLATETWSQISDGTGVAPPGRSSAAVAFDPQEGRLWLFGGNASQSGAAYAALDDTWSYDLATASWQEHVVGTRPCARLMHAGTFDPVRRRFVVFSGGDNSAFTAADYKNDLWGFDVDAPGWTLLHDGLSSSPDGRFMGAIAYDEAGGRYLAFGGHDDTSLGNTNDLWTFDPVLLTWDLLRRGDTFQTPIPVFCQPTVDFASVDLASPERRSSHAWVSACDHALTFGGKTDCGAIDDVWAFDYASGAWENPVPATVGEVCLRYQNGDPTFCAGLCQ